MGQTLDLTWIQDAVEQAKGKHTLSIGKTHKVGFVSIPISSKLV